ncbi:hypothetical protein DPMN_016130 [Dreissena polymorpha]|uniref:Uncharacterized protein n=1 Tax=Dreissena polymorpha TaxID=45954 RepID=A0A9D4S4A3_DREPO|nr:hypothetical protein DPMN_016130 [Dreissena polymorpha]
MCSSPNKPSMHWNKGRNSKWALIHHGQPLKVTYTSIKQTTLSIRLDFIELGRFNIIDARTRARLLSLQRGTHFFARKRKHTDVGRWCEIVSESALTVLIRLSSEYQV